MMTPGVGNLIRSLLSSIISKLFSIERKKALEYVDLGTIAAFPFVLLLIISFLEIFQYKASLIKVFILFISMTIFIFFESRLIDHAWARITSMINQTKSILLIIGVNLLFVGLLVLHLAVNGILIILTLSILQLPLM